eukprot:TRINITY_DN6937_c0_g1_i1.p1 TRINITY_DN6937_c0_g1~~TRINITY_DN6937_c0_g1_i1.p1  ORF type:complete len:473 (+),score=132.67 TRINITY_DN6937_c0_g1_i1:19-1437(+)
MPPKRHPTDDGESRLSESNKKAMTEYDRFREKLREKSELNPLKLSSDVWSLILNGFSPVQLAKLSSASSSFYLLVRSPLTVYREVEIIMHRKSSQGALDWMCKNGGEMVERLVISNPKGIDSRLDLNVVATECTQLRYLEFGTQVSLDSVAWTQLRTIKAHEGSRISREALDEIYEKNPNLEFVQLEHHTVGNRLEGIAKHCPHVKSITLGREQFSGLIEVVKNCKELEEIRLSNVNESEKFIPLLCDSPSFRSLSLSLNRKLEQEEINSLAKCKKMTDFKLSATNSDNNCGFDSASFIKLMKEWPDLKSLSFDAPILDAKNVDTLKTLLLDHPKLESLNWGDPKTTMKHIVAMSKAPNQLKQLDIKGLKFTNEKDLWKGFPHLQCLIFGGKNINGFIESLVQDDLPNLRKLSIVEGNEVQSISAITNLPNLKVFGGPECYRPFQQSKKWKKLEAFVSKNRPNLLMWEGCSL